jgi:hypothetical protein
MCMSNVGHETRSCGKADLVLDVTETCWEVDREDDEDNVAFWITEWS